jgi:hypothetical protein
METKQEGFYFFSSLSSNFIKLCRQLLGGGFEQIQNGSHCHGNQGAKNVKFKPYNGSF